MAAANNNNANANANSNGAIVSTLAGTGEYKFFDNKATSAAFKSVYGVALDAARGLLYVADRDDNRLRTVNLADGSTSTLAGSGLAGYGDGVGVKAVFNCPNGLAFDAEKSLLYVADQKNYSIRAVHTQTGAVTTIAGNHQKSGSADGKGANASFSFPSGLALDSKQQLLYVSDQNTALIRVVSLADGGVTTIAGDKNENEKRHADGKGLSAVFGAPVGLGLDTARQVLYVADRWGNRLRAINLDKASAQYLDVSTVAGAAEAGCVDGKGAAVRFDSPNGLAVDVARGLVYVADNQNHKIRVVNVADGSVSTIAGSGKKGFADGKGASAAFNWPKGLALDAAKQLIYVTDQDNHRVRVVDLSPVLTYATATGNGLSAAGAAAGAGAGAADDNKSAAAGISRASFVSELVALAQLKKEGLLTDIEFAAAKAKLLA